MIEAIVVVTLLHSPTILSTVAKLRTRGPRQYEQQRNSHNTDTGTDQEVSKRGVNGWEVMFIRGRMSMEGKVQSGSGRHSKLESPPQKSGRGAFEGG